MSQPPTCQPAACLSCSSPGSPLAQPLRPSSRRVTSKHQSPTRWWLVQLLFLLLGHRALMVRLLPLPKRPSCMGSPPQQLRLRTPWPPPAPALSPSPSPARHSTTCLSVQPRLPPTNPPPATSCHSACPAPSAAPLCALSPALPPTLLGPPLWLTHNDCHSFFPFADNTITAVNASHLCPTFMT